jgi:hypothetical protein
LLDVTRSLAFVAIVVAAPCEPRRSPPPPAVPEAQPVTIPHPGYLDDCVPRMALRPGEQRRFDFECGGEGLLGEDQFWWTNAINGIDPSDVQLKTMNPDIMTCGLCGCLFSLKFETSDVYGQLVSMPGRECGKFRRYCGTIQRSRKVSSAAELRSAVERRDRVAVVAFKRKWERGWTDDWTLTEARVKGIDHFMEGLVLEWTRNEEDGRSRTRHDAFTVEGRFYSGSEQVEQRGKLIARGGIYLTDGGEPLYRDLVYLGDRITEPDAAPDYELLFYELEVFRNARVISRYRSKLNFYVQSAWPAGGRPVPELARVPHDAELVAGVRSDEVERVREAR